MRKSILFVAIALCASCSHKEQNDTQSRRYSAPSVVVRVIDTDTLTKDEIRSMYGDTSVVMIGGKPMEVVRVAKCIRAQ